MRNIGKKTESVGSDFNSMRWLMLFLSSFFLHKKVEFYSDLTILGQNYHLTSNPKHLNVNSEMQIEPN